MRSVRIGAVCLTVAVALAASAAGAYAKSAITLKTSSGAVPTGGELKASSSNLTFKAGAIKVECASSEQVGELLVNAAKTTKGTFSTFSASGCKTVGGSATLVKCGAGTWETTLSEQIAKFGKKVTTGKGGVCLEVNTAEGGLCVYTATGVTSEFNIGGAEVITTKEQEFKLIGGSCATAGFLSETLTLSSKGEAVEVVSAAKEKPNVKLRTAKAGILPSGAATDQASSNLIFETSAGNVECSTNELLGTVTTNGAVKDLLTLAETEFAGLEIGGLCKTSALGPVEVIGQDLPWHEELTTKGAVTIKGTKKVAFTVVVVDLGENCTYEASKVDGTFATGAEGKPVPFETAITKQAFKVGKAMANAGCPKSGLLSGTASATSGGEAVEVEL